MPSSSLILRSSATIVSVLSFFSASTYAGNDFVYSNVDTFQGEDFTNTNKWDYFSAEDPTHGFVTYVDRDTAVGQSLATVNNGVFKMDVDHANINPNGPGRKSVRIESKKNWYQGLFVADVRHMPASVCGTWPAWWMLGVEGTWPSSGEIDIIEGVHKNQFSLAALHVSDVSVIDGDNSDQTGTTQQRNCNYNDPSFGSGKNPTGCGVLDTKTNTFGDAVNAGGRVFAMEWKDESIKVWSWAKSSVPSDALGAHPNPSGWGKPSQLFDGNNANIKDRFKSQKMIFDTTFCGDWAGAVWASEGCAASTGYSTCQEYVATNGAAFANSFWEIGAVKIYQKQAGVVTTTSTTSSTTTKASTTTSTTTKSSTTASTTSSSTTFSHYFGNFTTTSFDHGFPTTSTTSAFETTTTPYVTSSTTDSTTTTKGGMPNQPEGGVTGWPNGGASRPTSGWADWETPAVPTYTTTTITKTYVVPCETGLKTETATITTTYAIGKYSYTPTVPSSTYVTTLPVEWGFGGPVTVTMPVTETRTVIINGGKPTGYGNSNDAADPSWSVWSGASATTSKSVDPASTWAAWATSTSAKGVAQATGTAAVSDWNAWSASASSTGVQGVKAYTGAASRTAGSALIGALVAGAVGLFFL